MIKGNKCSHTSINISNQRQVLDHPSTAQEWVDRNVNTLKREFPNFKLLNAKIENNH